jgi:hypothetical protein
VFTVLIPELSKNLYQSFALKSLTTEALDNE